MTKNFFVMCVLIKTVLVFQGLIPSADVIQDSCTFQTIVLNDPDDFFD